MMVFHPQWLLLLVQSYVTLSSASHFDFSRARIDCGKERSGETGAIWIRLATQLEKRFQHLAGRLCYVKQRQIQTGIVPGPEAKTGREAPVAAVPLYGPY